MSSACSSVQPSAVQQTQPTPAARQTPPTTLPPVPSPPTGPSSTSGSLVNTISYEGRLSLMSNNGDAVHPSTAAASGHHPMDFDQSVVLRRIKAECDSMLINADGANFMADMSALYPAVAGLQDYILPPVSTPVRPGQSQQHQQTNDSGISPGSTGGATNSSSEDNVKKQPSNPSESGGDEPAHSPFSLIDDEDEMEEDEDMMDEEGEEEEDMLDNEDSSRGGSTSDVVGDALSRLERALQHQQQSNGVGIGGVVLGGGVLTSALPEGGAAVYQCTMCSYSATSRFHFQAHLNSHFDVKCTHCDFTARTEGKLRAHIRNAHSDVIGMEEGENGGLRVGRVSSSSNPHKSSSNKAHKCKQPDCGYVATSKQAFWEHTRSHIKAEKLLTCPHCPFVTEYKHHLDYHTRNHLNSKPFKCPKCSYACVNKSMLNSHMKSHSNVYQFRCKDCAYATKYQHSLKLHLRKYGHTCTTDLSLFNEDGQPVTKVKGRRGPKKPRKSKKEQSSEPVNSPPPVSSAPTTMTTPSAVAAKLAGSNPFSFPLYPPGLLMEPKKMSSKTPPSVTSDEQLCVNHCSQCEFSTTSKEHFTQHLMAHVAAAADAQHHQQRDLVSLFNASVDHLMGGGTPVTPLKGSSTPHHQVKDYLSRMLVGCNPTLLFSSPVQPPSVSPKSRTPTPPARSNPTPLDLSRERDDTHPAKHRRKGQAFKLERTTSNPAPEEPVVEEKGSGQKEEKGTSDATAEWGGAYKCSFCDIAFKDVVMYTMHMGYHGFSDPFTCNMCGQSTHDKVAFFLHIARSSHS